MRQRTTEDAMSVAERVEAESNLSSRLVQYAGKWVAVIDFEVVHKADTWDELLDLLNEAGQREVARVIHVPTHPGAINLY